MNDGGWVKIHRSMLNWEWWDDQNTARVWLTVLLLANHKAERWHGQTIEAGQMVTSYEKLAERSGLTIQKVRTALNKLKETGEVTVKSTNKNTLITIVKWADFQLLPGDSNKQITIKQQSNNKQLTTNKNEKKLRNKEYIYITPPEYIVQQMNGTLPEETPATEDDIQKIKSMQEKMKC